MIEMGEKISQLIVVLINVVVSAVPSWYL